MQNKLTVENGSGLSVRTGFNDAIQSLASLFSGPADPATQDPSNAFPFMLWVDTQNNKLMQRNAENTAWIVRGDLNKENLGFVLSDEGIAVGGAANKFVKTNADGYLDRSLKQKYLIPSSSTSYVGQWVKLGDITIYGSGSSYTATLNVIDGAWDSYGMLRIYIRVSGSPLTTDKAELTWLSASGKLESLYGNFKLVYSTADPTKYSLWFNPTINYEKYYFTVGEEGGNGNWKMTYYSDQPYQYGKPAGTVVSAAMVSNAYGVKVITKTSDFTIPSSTVYVTMCGGGGGGGYTSERGPGGDSLMLDRYKISGLKIGSTVSVIIGAGGKAATSGYGLDGGYSSFGPNIKALGGGGGDSGGGAPGYPLVPLEHYRTTSQMVFIDNSPAVYGTGGKSGYDDDDGYHVTPDNGRPGICIVEWNI